jgi:hypothetical protein
VPPRGTAERKEWHLAVPNICGKCHEEHLEDWTDSIHGKEASENHNLKTAVCSDCHTTHDIGNSSSDKVKLHHKQQWRYQPPILKHPLQFHESQHHFHPCMLGNERTIL